MTRLPDKIQLEDMENEKVPLEVALGMSLGKFNLFQHLFVLFSVKINVNAQRS